MSIKTQSFQRILLVSLLLLTTVANVQGKPMLDI